LRQLAYDVLRKKYLGELYRFSDRGDECDQDVQFYRRPEWDALGPRESADTFSSFASGSCSWVARAYFVWYDHVLNAAYIKRRLMGPYIKRIEVAEGVDESPIFLRLEGESVRACVIRAYQWLLDNVSAVVNNSVVRFVRRGSGPQLSAVEELARPMVVTYSGPTKGKVRKNRRKCAKRYVAPRCD
jgi:hypothetical protein